MPEHDGWDPEDHEGHRGGAWKVAYADFVTALMALFIVLWLMGSSREVKEAVSAYFRSPRGVARLNGSGRAGSGVGLKVNSENVSDLKTRLEKTIKDTPALRKIAPYVTVTVTGEGLRIELTEASGEVFFETGSPNPTSAGMNLFNMLAKELGDLPNPIIMEGHTDSTPFRGAAPDSYGNWELSFDRANMARRMMMNSGLRPEQVAEIRGFADRHPLTGNAGDSKNRRISVILQFQSDDKDGGIADKKTGR